MWLGLTMGTSVAASICVISVISIDSWFGWGIKCCVCVIIHVLILVISSLIFYKNDFKDVMVAGISIIKK
jgi:hypothetical protein